MIKEHDETVAKAWLRLFYDRHLCFAQSKKSPMFIKHRSQKDACRYMSAACD
jgi:hypothetical protein